MNSISRQESAALPLTPERGFASNESELPLAPVTTHLASVRTASEIVNQRRIINGPSDKLRAVSCTKYPWARDIWDQMIANTWYVTQVPLGQDKTEFPTLDHGSRTALLRALAFLSNLDGIQTENLSLNVANYITDPSINQNIGRQVFEEWIHVEMYSAMVESLYDDPMEVYDMHHHVPQLSAKNQYIQDQCNKVTLMPNDANKVKSMVSNIILEGVFFFSGFLTFYAVGRATKKMQGSVDAIRYIQRDELTHLKFFVMMYNSLRAESPEIFTAELADECRQMFRDACELEISWGKYQIEFGVLGLTDQIETDYIQHRTEKCATMIGLGGIFPDVKNPVAWVDDYSIVNGTHENFFETKPIGYSEVKPQFGVSRRGAAPPKR